MDSARKSARFILPSTSGSLNGSSSDFGLMDASHRHTFPSVGRCIYCGTTTAKLSEEHIIPQSINGYYVLPEASCDTCAAHINLFEQQMIGGTYLPLRLRLRLRSRKNRKRNSLSARITDFASGAEEARSMPYTDFPDVYAGFHTPAPGIMLGIPPNDTIPFRIHLRTLRTKIEGLAKEFKLTPQRGFLLTKFYPSAFLLLLAKIAHGFAVADFGIDSFLHRLTPLILNKQTADTLPYLIGCDERPLEPTHRLHEIGFGSTEIKGITYCLVTVRLFAMLGSPRYVVVVGEDLTNKVCLPQNSGHR